MCVLRVYPSALDSVLGANNQVFGLSTQSTFEDPWFCPCHTCVGCHVLQESAAELTLSQVPLSLHSAQQRALMSVEARQRAITAAATTTMAVSSTGSNDSVGSDLNSLFDSAIGPNSAATDGGNVPGATVVPTAEAGASQSAAQPSVTAVATGVSSRRRSAENNSNNNGNHSIGGATTSSHSQVDDGRVSSLTGLRYKALRGCAACPFAICTDCERDMVHCTTDKTRLLHERRVTEVSCSVFVALCCKHPQSVPLAVYLTYYRFFMTGVGVSQLRITKSQPPHSASPGTGARVAEDCQFPPGRAFLASTAAPLGSTTAGDISASGGGGLLDDRTGCSRSPGVTDHVTRTHRRGCGCQAHFVT
jgi:hypothetical protein